LDDFDKAGALETVDCVIEGASLEDEQLVFVTVAEEFLHLVGVHGGFAQEGEDCEFPKT
jgi:hypothetical protein